MVPGCVSPSDNACLGTLGSKWLQYLVMILSLLTMPVPGSLGSEWPYFFTVLQAC